MRCWVVWDTGQAGLRQGENILGRDRAAAVWLDSIDVSRRHARILVEGAEAMLEDLDSRNGTFIRGNRVTAPVRLLNGDRIELGSTVVTFRVSQDDASTQSRISNR